MDERKGQVVEMSSKPMCEGADERRMQEAGGEEADDHWMHWHGRAVGACRLSTRTAACWSCKHLCFYVLSARFAVCPLFRDWLEDKQTWGWVKEAPPSQKTGGPSRAVDNTKKIKKKVGGKRGSQVEGRWEGVAASR